VRTRPADSHSFDTGSSSSAFIASNLAVVVELSSSIFVVGLAPAPPGFAERLSLPPEGRVHDGHHVARLANTQSGLSSRNEPWRIEQLSRVVQNLFVLVCSVNPSHL
jgi:hypothetical protein